MGRYQEAATPKKWQGAKVRLLRDLVTRGGTHFRKGLIMTVGRMSSVGNTTLHVYKRGWHKSIDNVHKSSFEVISWGTGEED